MSEYSTKELVLKNQHKEHEESLRVCRIDGAKELYHIHDLDEGYWDNVHDITYEYLPNGLTRHYLKDANGNIIDSFDR